MSSNGSRLRTALRHSRLAAVRDWLAGGESTGRDGPPGRLGAAVTGSWLYGWLTADPDPEFVVVDLRETLFVGPVVDRLDGSLDRVCPYWRASRLHDGLAGLGRAGDRLAATRAGRLLARFFVPSAPDEAGDRTDR